MKGTLVIVGKSRVVFTHNPSFQDMINWSVNNSIEGIEKSKMFPVDVVFNGGENEALPSLEAPKKEDPSVKEPKADSSTKKPSSEPEKSKVDAPQKKKTVVEADLEEVNLDDIGDIDDLDDL